MGITRVAVLATAAALLLPASAAADVLYDQLTPAGVPNADPSMPNFSPSVRHPDGTYDDTADDFTVPPGTRWVIQSVDVTGAYSGTPSNIVNVAIHPDSGGAPGEVLFEQDGISATNGPNYSVPVSGAPTLSPGTYWITVQEQATGSAFWSWGTRTVQSGSPAHWFFAESLVSNPCTAGSWFVRNFCWAGPNADQAFSLSGTASPIPSDFTFGKVKLNKKKGTATLAVTLPGPGSVQLSGKSVVPQNLAVEAAGTQVLPVKPSGSLKKKLKKSGKAKAKLSVAFTPTDGTANTETDVLKLKRKQH